MEIKYAIPGSVSEVYPFFADLIKFGDTHPIIYKVEQTGPNEYLFYEELNMLVYKHRFTYSVTLESAEVNKKVTMYSNVQKGVYLHLTFVFSEANGNTQIDETVLVKANPLVKMIFNPLLKKSHLKLVNEITRRLAGDAETAR